MYRRMFQKMMGDQYYHHMWLRRRFCKRIVFIIAAFIVAFYATVLLFGDLKTPKVMHLTDLNRCPACYGISVCPELYSNQIILETKQHWSALFNAKNIYYGFTKASSRRVVLKKLAHDWELQKLDENLCSIWKLHQKCKPAHLLNVTQKIVDEEINKIVKFNISWPDTEPRKGLVMCPYATSIVKLIQPILINQGNHKAEMINIWTMLSINPEPIILQLIPKSKGWPVPAFGGVCGRVELLAYEGEPLSSLLHVAWHRRLKFAKQILDAALDFTYRHERFRFYLMDWSIDNIVVNEKDVVTFVDLEDVVVLDKHILPDKELPDWYKRYNRENLGPGFTFSIENMCKHHLSDHNLWAACYVLAGEEKPLLLPIPKDVNKSRPHFQRLLNECLNHEDRFHTVTTLQHVISDLLNDEDIVGFGVVR